MESLTTTRSSQEEEQKQNNNPSKPKRRSRKGEKPENKYFARRTNVDKQTIAQKIKDRDKIRHRKKHRIDEITSK